MGIGKQKVFIRRSRKAFLVFCLTCDAFLGFCLSSHFFVGKTRLTNSTGRLQRARTINQIWFASKWPYLDDSPLSFIIINLIVLSFPNFLCFRKEPLWPCHADSPPTSPAWPSSPSPSPSNISEASQKGPGWSWSGQEQASQGSRGGQICLSMFICAICNFGDFKQISLQVIVVGGGAVGASTAYHLASKGAGDGVLLLEASLVYPIDSQYVRAPLLPRVRNWLQGQHGTLQPCSTLFGLESLRLVATARGHNLSSRNK